MAHSIEFNEVTKRFGERTALRAVSFSVPIGAIFGLVGLNGAGKTTLLRILTGELAPDGGSVTIASSVELGSLAKVTHDFPGSTISDMIREAVRGLLSR